MTNQSDGDLVRELLPQHGEVLYGSPKYIRRDQEKINAAHAALARLEADLATQRERAEQWKGQTQIAEAQRDALAEALRGYHVLTAALANCVNECGEMLLYSDLRDAQAMADVAIAALAEAGLT